MKTINQIIIAGSMSMLAATNIEAQVKVKAAQANLVNANESTIINQLSTRPAVVNMPVSQLLNAPGNETLKAFFFTPVKNNQHLRVKR